MPTVLPSNDGRHLIIDLTLFPLGMESSGIRPGLALLQLGLASAGISPGLALRTCHYSNLAWHRLALVPVWHHHGLGGIGCRLGLHPASLVYLHAVRAGLMVLWVVTVREAGHIAMKSFRAFSSNIYYSIHSKQCYCKRINFIQLLLFIWDIGVLLVLI